MPTPIKEFTDDSLRFELQRGSRIVMYQYCLSLLVVSLKRFSPVYVVKPEESAVTPGLPYVALALVAGWWGIPWGPIWTIQSVVINLRGGKDLTEEVQQKLAQAALAPKAQAAAASALPTK